MLILSDNVIVFVYRYYHRRRQYNFFFCVAGIMAVPTLFFVKLSDNAYPPVKMSAYAAGFDLRSAYDCMIAPHDNALVKTDLAVKIPEKCYGRIAPRSGLALKPVSYTHLSR